MSTFTPDEQATIDALIAHGKDELLSIGPPITGIAHDELAQLDERAIAEKIVEARRDG